MRIHFRSILLLTAGLVLALLAGCQGQAEPTLDTTALAENIAVNIFSTLTAQPTITPSTTSTPAAPVVIANTRVPLRSGPGREFSATRRLDAGTPAAVLAISEDGRWVQVSPHEEPFSEYGDGGWVGLSPQISISGDLSNIPVQDVMITATENTYEISRITATAAAENILALIPPSVTPAPTLDVPVLVSTVQVAVLETLIAPQLATVTAQAQRQLDQQATQTAVASQPIEVLPDDDPALGLENAPVLIIEFSDFSCPHCADFAINTLPRILETYGDQVRFVFRDAPILGPASGWAALGAECADDQGQFWAFHDLLFNNQSSISPENLPAFAQQAGLDLDTFNTCVQNQTHLPELQNDLNAAAAAGLSGTPLFYINGERVEGAQPFEAFAQIIEAELAKAGVEMTPEVTAEVPVEATIEATPESTPDA